MSWPPYYTVVVCTRDVQSECLLGTERLRDALSAIEVLGLMAPDVTVRLYVTDDDAKVRSAKVLDVRDGVWRVTAPAVRTESAA